MKMFSPAGGMCQLWEVLTFKKSESTLKTPDRIGSRPFGNSSDFGTRRACETRWEHPEKGALLPKMGSFLPKHPCFGHVQ